MTHTPFPLHFRGCPAGPSNPTEGACTCDSRKVAAPVITRGTPIEKMGDISLASPLEARIVEKLEEIIDRINAMNEVSR